ncbi:universal stress protein [Miltoncostaea oceani]|uniref:universal stress protein n=1 Tax=Miltoncostaea oceani TaxID=2843216 RepID=UPI001C3CEE20|nr:universal stress protein [Miltoncostaea oceani]
MPDGLALIGYDGSESADRAITAAAAVLGRRPALVVVAWESGAAYTAFAAATIPTATIDFGAAAAADQGMFDGARHTADRGALLATEAGFFAEGLAVAEDGDVADALARVAAERDAEVIVVGARGHGLERRLLGSTSRRLLERSPCPVLVVPAPGD